MSTAPWSLALAAGDTNGQLAPIEVTAPGGSDANTVVRANRIEVEQATSLRDIFRQTPEVNVSGGPTTAQKIYVRGINERMLNISVDGAAQPESAYHHTGQVMIEPELLKEVDIEAGTGAATAGPGALGGAVRFTTKTAEDMLRPGERAGALLKSSYQSASEGKKMSLTGFAKVTEDTGVLTSFTRLMSSDYRSGDGQKVRNSGTAFSDVFVKFNTRFTNAHRFSLSHESLRDDDLHNKKTNLFVTRTNPPSRQRIERSSTVFNYDYAPGDPLIKTHVSAYANDNSLILGVDQPRQDLLGTRTNGLNLSNVSRLGKHKLSYGYDYRRDAGYAHVPDNTQPDEIASVNGVFVQDDFSLTPEWLLTGGLRYDRYAYTDSKRNEYSSSGFSPSASLTWSPISPLSVRLSHARALRGVGVIEPFLMQYQENDPTLKAEKASNTELGASWHDGPWSISGTLFSQRIANFIGYDDMRSNLGTVKVKGYSASAAYRLSDWSASLGISDARPSLNGAPLSDENALLLGTSFGRTWVAQLDYALPQQNIKLGWTGRLVEKLDRVPAGSQTKAGYALHDIYGQWRPSGKDDFTITLSVKNLFDRYYYDQGSFGYSKRFNTIIGLPETGRDIRLTLAWRL